MTEYTSMPPQQGSTVEALLDAEQQPVANNVLLSLAESVHDRREHQHPTHEDIYCGNLTAWAGERTGAVLRRLVDAEREIERLHAELKARPPRAEEQSPTSPEAPTYWLAEHGDDISLWATEREAMNECDEITRAGARGCWDWVSDRDDSGTMRQIWVSELDDRPVGDAGGRVTPLRVQGSASSTEIEQLRAERDELLAELNGRGEEARERWIARELEKTGLRSVNFRNGMSMEIEPAREMVAAWVGAARAMLGDAENYSETPIEMVVKVAEDPERYAFVLQRVGRLTPHEARQQAEAEVKRLRAELAARPSRAKVLRDVADAAQRFASSPIEEIALAAFAGELRRMAHTAEQEVQP